ncbi:acetylxylan esterase [Chitinophaga pendula]|uniref:alpha/beta hydrolase family protein n=1 Tax=Chitinophaga TaxID=79328 RepID=UPI0012FE0898|nr:MULTISPECIES: acetylxylan esterase [Chitinophaga]UCJ08290.1 acetylxylan esterase [Chitinophaga pendula]
MVVVTTPLCGQTTNAANQPEDRIAAQLRKEAAAAFRHHSTSFSMQHWRETKEALKQKIIRHTGVRIDHDLPLLYRETGHTQQNGYVVKNILFQTQPGVMATANLYIPDGKGPFPAVINSHGHWKDARMGEMVQSLAHSLAQQGFVCLNIDAWGAGERTSIQGEAEYHGANLGASLMNIGTSLMGMQLTDNIRGVDLLCTLQEVDKTRIGATGASGGGNQTMWLAALDERIKAAAPVVSVGTFESYIVHSNCVCELLPDGLTFTEEAAVLGLIAPRALKICNAQRDASKSFSPQEMLRTYHQLSPIYAQEKAKDKCSYEIFNTTHGYWPEIRAAVLGWFTLQLKGTGTGAPQQLATVDLLSLEQLAVFPHTSRDTAVMSTAAYCHRQGTLRREAYLHTTAFNQARKRKELAEILRLQPVPPAQQVQHKSKTAGWEQIELTTAADQLPVLLKRPSQKGKTYTIILTPAGKDSIPAKLIQELTATGNGIVLVDGWGIGTHNAPEARKIDGSLPPFHTLARSMIWLGKTIQGQWVQELQLLTAFLRQELQASSISIHASKELAVAALCFAALDGNISSLALKHCPVSYVFDQRAGIDYFNMAIHIPGILPWGDISLLAALSNANIILHEPVTMSGHPLDNNTLKSYQQEFNEINIKTGRKGQTVLKNENFDYEK